MQWAAVQRHLLAPFAAGAAGAAGAAAVVVAAAAAAAAVVAVAGEGGVVAAGADTAAGGAAAGTAAAAARDSIHRVPCLLFFPRRQFVCAGGERRVKGVRVTISNSLYACPVCCFFRLGTLCVWEGRGGQKRNVNNPTRNKHHTAAYSVCFCFFRVDNLYARRGRVGQREEYLQQPRIAVTSSVCLLFRVDNLYVCAAKMR